VRLDESGGCYQMTFMNKGMQSKKQRIAVIVIIGVVLATFLVSIVALSFI
jgi:hypothetical protein